jgi:hypothetical protein
VEVRLRIALLVVGCRFTIKIVGTHFVDDSLGRCNITFSIRNNCPHTCPFRSPYPRPFRRVPLNNLADAYHLTPYKTRNFFAHISDVDIYELLSDRNKHSLTATAAAAARERENLFVCFSCRDHEHSTSKSEHVPCFSAINNSRTSSPLSPAIRTFASHIKIKINSHFISIYRDEKSSSRVPHTSAVWRV